MPTGLTSKIYDGRDMSFRNFALDCVRYLGYGYRASDHGEKEMPKDKAPILSPDPYHKKCLEITKNELMKWQDLKNRPDELQAIYEREMAKLTAENEEMDNDREDRRSRYLEMLDKVVAWKPSSEYSSLKKLMHDQLTESMNFDCGKPNKEKKKNEPVPSIDEWYKTQIEHCKWEIKYHTEGWEKEVNNTAETNAYIKGLYDELDKVEPFVKAEEKYKIG